MNFEHEWQVRLIAISSIVSTLLFGGALLGTCVGLGINTLAHAEIVGPQTAGGYGAACGAVVAVIVLLSLAFQKRAVNRHTSV